MKKNILIFLTFTVMMVSCRNEIISGTKLSYSDKELLRSLEILGPDEIVFNFYSEYRNHISGSFYTDQRIASYWMDERSRVKRRTETVFYADIANIDTVLNTGISYCPYMRVVRNDSSSFKAYFDGETESVRSAFKQALSMWKYYREQALSQ